MNLASIAKTIRKILRILLPQLHKRKFADGMIVFNEKNTFIVVKGYFDKRSHRFMYNLKIVSSEKFLEGSEIYLLSDYVENNFKIKTMPSYNSVWNKINGNS